MEYYELKKEERFKIKGNYDNWDAAQKHLEAYCPRHITFNDVNLDFVKGFKIYLDKVAVTKSQKNLSQTTKHTCYNNSKLI